MEKRVEVVWSQSRRESLSLFDISSYSLRDRLKRTTLRCLPVHLTNMHTYVLTYLRVYYYYYNVVIFSHKDRDAFVIWKYDEWSNEVSASRSVSSDSRF